MDLQRRTEACPSLPPGWTRQVVMRMGGGNNVGKFDIYYYSPKGKRVRSKPELIREVGDVMDLSAFHYNTGKMSSSLIKPGRSKKQAKKTVTAADSCPSPTINNASSLVPPIRQTASIFKQPVTVYKTHETEVKKNVKTDKDKPRQLFWEKRLNNLRTQQDTEAGMAMSLPPTVRELECLRGRSSTNTLLASISTALHLDKKPVVGQDPSDELEKNPVVFLNPDQPIVGALQVSDQDIRQQELRVNEARIKLAQAVKALG